MSEMVEKEKELEEAEKRRKIAEQLKNEAPSLKEKLRFLSEELEARKKELVNAEAIVDLLVARSKEIHEEESKLYRKLQEITPKVVAEVKS